jgi:hypothetical protein
VSKATHAWTDENAIREYLVGHPEWMIEDCIGWTHEREAVGHRYADAAAAAQHWLAATNHLAAESSRIYWIPTAGAAGVQVYLVPPIGAPGGTDCDSWICRGCGEYEKLAGERDSEEALFNAGVHAAMCGRGTAATKLEKDLADARGELARVDAKAATLLTVAGVALTVGLTVLGRTHLPAIAAVTGWLAVALLGTGVVLLALAIQPNLSGNHGFVRYAAAADGEQLLADVARERRTNRRPLSDLADQLVWTARAARGKYLRVRYSVTLLLAGLAATAVTALLAFGLA